MTSCAVRYKNNMEELMRRSMVQNMPKNLQSLSGKEMSEWWVVVVIVLVVG